MMINNPIIEPVNQDKTAQDLTNAQNAGDGTEFNDVMTEMKAVKDTSETEKVLNEQQQVAEETSPEENALVQAKNKLKEQLKKLGEKDKLAMNLSSIDGIGLFINPHNIDKEFFIKINNLDKTDIDFFKTCAEKGGISLNDINLQAAQAKIMVTTTPNDISYKSIDFSKGLANLIEYAHTTQKPVRLDFQGDTSVVLRVDNKGLLSAQFIPGNPAMEYALKASLPDLRNRFEAEGIPYKELSYREDSQQNRGNNKDKDNKGDRQ